MNQRIVISWCACGFYHEISDSVTVYFLEEEVRRGPVPPSPKKKEVPHLPSPLDLKHTCTSGGVLKHCVYSIGSFTFEGNQGGTFGRKWF